MIAEHQPVIFTSAVTAAASSRDDGDMKFGIVSPAEVVAHREAFLAALGISLEQTVLVKVSYEKTDFTLYRSVGASNGGEGMRDPEAPVADGVATNEPNVALFLPIADCAGAVLFDPVKKVIMVSHLGRQSIEQQGAAKSVAFLQQAYGSRPADVLLWMSPAAGQDNYPLWAFDGRSLADVARQQCIEAGVPDQNIELCPVDTTESDDYFSHSQFLKGQRDSDGRFAVVAMMLEQGEPAV